MAAEAEAATVAKLSLADTDINWDRLAIGIILGFLFFGKELFSFA